MPPSSQPALSVLGFGTYDLRKHPRVGIILDGFRAHGDAVAEVNEPLGFSTQERVEMLGKPWMAYRLVLRLLRRWVGLARRARPFRTGTDVVLVGYLGHFDILLARLLFPRATRVLDLMIFSTDTARDRGMTGGLKFRLLDALERLAIACADVVVLDTDEHRALLPHHSAHKGVVVPVGAPHDWFVGSGPTGRHQPRPAGELRVVFYGLFTPLQGAPVIGAALAALADSPGISVTMIGEGQDYTVTRAAAAANAGVTWRDWVEPEGLPKIVADHDVCLGIFGTGPKAHRVVPNKVFQGAAAGCAIVTSDTPPQRAMLGDAAIYVEPGDAAGLAAVLKELADDPGRLAALRASASEAARARFSARAIVVPLRARLMG